MAINFHAFGNLFIHPFNYDDAKNNLLNREFAEYGQMYNEIWTECGLPSGNVKGNGKITVNYDANGEASDWMLGALNILAMSPELGNSDYESNSFFIHDKNLL